MRSRALVAIALVVAAAAITTLHRLGAADVCSSNEAVEAVFLQQMVEHDALLFPLENGRSPMYKPPLFHWTAVAIDRLAGIKKVTAFNLRLPAALYAIAGVILTIAFVYAFLGPGAAILAGLILTASYQYLENARIGRVDMTLCFFETLALFAFAWWSAPHVPAASATPRLVQEVGTRAARGDEGSPDDFAAQADSQATDELRVRHEPPLPLVKGPETRSTGGPEVRSTDHEAEAISESAPHQDSSMGPPHRGHNYLRYLLALALGLAVLAKGPVGAMLPGLAILLFLLAERRLRDVWKLATPGPVVLTLAIASSWYLACLFGHHYGFLHRQIGSENFGRFFGSLGAMGLTYYIKPLLLNSVPLSLLVPVAGFFALCTYRRSNEPSRPFPLAREPGVRSRPPQNPLSLWMSLRMMFLPPMDDPAANPPAAAGDAGRVTLAVRLFAIFWVTTVLFFTIAAYKRRTYLLPLWPTSAVILSWWLTSLTRTRSGRILRRAVAATCVILITINFFYLPCKEVRECAGDSMREAAAQINRVVGATEPLYLFQFEDEPAPLLFYLDRTAPRIWGKLGDAPPGYVITTAEAWDRLKGEALDLQPVLESSSGRPRLVLLRHGKALARR